MTPVNPSLPHDDYWTAAGTARREDPTSGARQEKFAARFQGCSMVIDLGCGLGEFLRQLRDAGVAAIGVDSSAAACAACEAEGLRAVHADVRSYLQVDGPAVDGVFNGGLLEHLDRGDVEALVARVADRLEPGGLFVTVLPNPASILTHLTVFHEDPTHVRLYPPRYFAALCRRCGLEIVEVAEDEETLRGWGGRFDADFEQLAPLAARDPRIGVLIQVVKDFATHFNTVIDQLVRPVEFYVVARKPEAGAADASRPSLGADARRH